MVLGYVVVEVSFVEARLADAGYCDADFGHCILEYTLE